MADASSNPAGGYYSGRPLGLEHDQQQAQAEPAPPQATAGEQANGLPAPQPQPRQDVGEQVANHTHVHGVPGYYNGRVNNMNTAAAPPPPPPAPAVEPERNLSWIDKCILACGSYLKPQVLHRRQKREVAQEFRLKTPGWPRY